MSLQFIFGNSGSGKSTYLYDQVISDSMQHPQKNYLVLVPEQFTMQTQKDLVIKHPNKGIMNIDVLSFGRLAHRIFEEVGGNTKVMLDDVGKNFILRKIAGEYEGQLKVLGSNLKKLGYITEVKSVISEFTQYDIGAKELETILEDITEQSYLYYKLQDIKKVYEGFQNYLEEKYISREELLDELCLVVKQSEILKNSVVVLDGFTGFTPVQNKLLKELLTICDKIIITVTIDEKENPYVYEHPYQLFAISKQMVSSLVKIAREQKVEIADPVCLYEKPVIRFRDNKAMAFLESEIFRYSKKQFQEEQSSISLHSARNPQEEARFVARQIRLLIRIKGYRYRDIAVITGDMNTYADHIEKIFATYDIPLFMDHKRSVLLNSFVEYLRSLLAMIEQNFTYESVFRFLRTGLTDFTDEEIDKLENYVIALGIKGFKNWQARWIRLAKGSEESELERLNSLRVQFVEKLDDLVFVLKQRKKTVYDVTLALYQFLEREQMQKELMRYELKFQEEGELALAKEYGQIYKIVLELFDKFVELLGDEYIPLKEYRDLLDSGLSEAKVGVIPPSLDQVMVGDMERTRLKDIKVLFLMGVNDTLIPGNLGQSGLLSERDREHFADEKFVLAPGPKEKAYIQKFYLYQNLTKPTDNLYLSFSKVSSEGKSLRPAYLIQDMKRLYPRLKIQDEEKKTLKELELTPKNGMAHIIQGLRERGREQGGAWEELYTWYFRNSKWRAHIELLVEAAFYKKPQDKLTQELAEKIYGEAFRGSVTRLERFSACAYAHFLMYGLRLRERQEYQFEALDLGNVFHSAMERFSNKIASGGYDWVNLPKDISNRFIEDSIEESIVDYNNTVLYSSARNEYMITRMKRLMRRTVWGLTKQLEHGDFVPDGYEVKFESGKIDRIDTCEDGDKVYVKVMDYKTGSKAFDMVALYNGLQLQLVVYMNAALNLEQRKHPGKEIVPAGIFYYQIKDPIVEKETDREKLEAAILKELKLDGLVNGEDAVIRHLDKNLIGSSNVIPVGRNKDQSLSKVSKAVTDEDFYVITEYAQHKVEEMDKRILGGEVEAKPYEMGQQTGCDYCKYKDICAFDPKLEGYEYRRLKKEKTEEILAKMREEV